MATLIEPVQTASLWIDLKADLKNTDVLFAFGFNKEIYERLSSWLNKGDNRFLVFIETDKSQFLEAKLKGLSEDKKLRCYLLENAEEELLLHLAWEFVFLRFGYIEPREPYFAAALDFLKKMEHYHRGVDLLASDAEDMGLKVLKNAVANLSLLSKAKLGLSLEGKCLGMPAIVCGAGPSLDDLDLAPYKDKALFIAGGTAALALAQRGISAHLLAHVDPLPELKKFLIHDHFQTPLFYQGRANHELLQNVHGPLVWMPDSGSYPLESWLAAECGIASERFDSGWTVGNFCVAIAAFLGCSPIILVGMDSSCGPDATYASGIVDAQGRKALIELKPKELYSKRDWLMSAEWLSAFAQKHPHIEWVNVSERGIDIPGIPRRKLSALSLSPSLDLEGQMHALMTEAPIAYSPGVSSVSIEDVKKKIYKSFEKSEQICDALLKIWERHFPNSPLEDGEYALLNSDLEEEVCYQYFLMPLWTVWQHPILRLETNPLGQHVHRLLFFKNALELHLRKWA